MKPTISATMTTPPDEPRWVEANGMLGSGEAWTKDAGAGHVIGLDRAQLMVAVGDADPAAVLELAVVHGGWTLLAAPEHAVLGAAMVAAGWTVTHAVIHTMPDPAQLPEHHGVVQLPDSVSLDDLPPPLDDEITAARKQGPVWTVVVDGAPRAFAYAPWHSRRWFDVSVDTIPGYRQLGLGTRVASALIRHERAAGREPVWGALEDHAASLRLAQRLGFAPMDRLLVATLL